ncbi:CAAX prenyl protease-related protein [Planctomycetota bacterium]
MSDDKTPNDDAPSSADDSSHPDVESVAEMSDEASSAPAADAKPDKPKKPRIELGPPVFGKWRHFIVVIPFIVYLAFSALGGKIESMRESYLIGTLGRHPDNNTLRVPTLEEATAQQIEKDPDQLFLLDMFKVVESTYPYTYMVTVGVTSLFVLAFCWGYFKIRFRLSYWGFVYGVVGIVVWIALVMLDEATLKLGAMTPGRAAFNPFEELADNKSFMNQFLGFRLFGMIMLVPLVEEFFIRGFLMRYVDDPDWDEVPIGVFRLGGLLAPTIYGLATHLTEPLAAVAWFSLITVLYRKTNNIWDCVVAHAVTNGLLAWYVIQYEQWQLW